MSKFDKLNDFNKMEARKITVVYDLPRIGTKSLSRKGFDQNNPYLLPGPYYKQEGRGLSQISSILMSIDKNRIATILVLLLLSKMKKYKNLKNGKQSGGFQINQLINRISNLNKNVLIIILALILMYYFSHGSMENSISKISQHLSKMEMKDINYINYLLNSFGNISIKNGKKIIDQLNEFITTVMENTPFSRSQKGGSNLLQSLANTIEDTLNDINGVDENTNKSKNHKGGNLSQYGCKIPEWGYYLEGSKCI